jgi:hypothetical protein
MPTAGNRLLREVIERIGVEQVAAKLSLSPISIEAFKAGTRRVNDALLLKLIDLVDSLPKKQ